MVREVDYIRLGAVFARAIHNAITTVTVEKMVFIVQRTEMRSAKFDTRQEDFKAV